MSELLTFTPWQVQTQPGARLHHPTSRYAETYYTPVIGPTSLLLCRRVATWLMVEVPEPVVRVELAVLAGQLGTGPEPVRRNMARLVRFGILNPRGTDGDYAIRLGWKELTPGMLKRLPVSLQMQHDADRRARV